MNYLQKFLLLIIFSCFILQYPVQAEEFSLQKIGTLNVDGKYYTHWWFSGTKPVLQGTGSRGANIDITIDSDFKTIKASETDGSWKYTPEAALEKKDHSVTIASGTDKISFILTIGSDMPADAQTKGGVSELPQTGNLIPTILLITLTSVLLYYGLRGKLV